MNVDQLVEDEQKIIGLMPLANGRPFSPLNPDLREFDINVLAHSLARNCRFNGHTVEHDSVAQHSVLVSIEMEAAAFGRVESIIDAAIAGKWGLFHDASEGYGLPDLSRMVKRSAQMQGYRDAEQLLQRMIYGAVGLSGEAPGDLGLHDLRVGATEARDFLVNGIPLWWPAEYHDSRNHLSQRLIGWSYAIARQRFLDRYAYLEDRLKTRTPAASFSRG